MKGKLFSEPGGQKEKNISIQERWSIFTGVGETDSIQGWSVYNPLISYIWGCLLQYTPGEGSQTSNKLDSCLAAYSYLLACGACGLLHVLQETLYHFSNNLCQEEVTLYFMTLMGFCNCCESSVSYILTPNVEVWGVPAILWTDRVWCGTQPQRGGKRRGMGTEWELNGEKRWCVLLCVYILAIHGHIKSVCHGLDRTRQTTHARTFLT